MYPFEILVYSVAKFYIDTLASFEQAILVAHKLDLSGSELVFQRGLDRDLSRELYGGRIYECLIGVFDLEIDNLVDSDLI